MAIITHDQPEAHRAALHGLLEEPQCDDAWEIVICDNGVAPRMIEVAGDIYAASSVPLRYIWRRACANEARNTAIANASSPVVLLFDGDIVPSPRLVQRHLNLHRSGTPLIVAGRRRWRTLQVDVDCDAQPRSVYSQLLEKTVSRDPKAREREEREFAVQAAAMVNGIAWRFCMSCHMSFRVSSTTYFDERMRGWGLEDVEFVLRNTIRGGYTATYIESLDAWHLDCDTRAFNPFRTTHGDSEAANAYVNNVLLVLDQFSDLPGIADVAYGFDRLTLNPVTDSWEVVTRSSRDRSRRGSRIEEARAWITRQGGGRP